MKKNTKHTPQAQRIIEFVKLTGLTQTQFSVQCGFKSPSTMQMICTEGQSPTTKTLSKIVHRFPQLNYDWVLMGIGEMINRSFAKAPSSKSQQRSTRATFDQISKNQSVSDLKTNELKSDVSDLMKLMKDTMILTAQQNGMLTIKIEEMAQAIKEGQDFIKEKEAKRDAFFEKMHADELVKINSLDQKRVKTIERLDTERRVNREEGQAKLSQKIYEYLKESRELIFAALNKAKNEAVNESHEKFNVQLGEHTINKKPKSTLR
jgi:hypothetical protein